MKVFINDKEVGGRKEVEVELVKETATTVWVKLPDGNIISRKKERDLVKEEVIKQENS